MSDIGKLSHDLSTGLKRGFRNLNNLHSIEETKAIVNYLETYSSKLEGFDRAQSVFDTVAQNLRATIPVRPATI
jgi:hypothetical protein